MTIQHASKALLSRRRLRPHSNQILTGLTMSPAMDAASPWLMDVFGGRQSARSIHFIRAMLLVHFFLVHILMVALVGPINEVRSMITGHYRLPAEHN